MNTRFSRRAGGSAVPSSGSVFVVEEAKSLYDETGDVFGGETGGSCTALGGGSCALGGVGDAKGEVEVGEVDSRGGGASSTGVGGAFGIGRLEALLPMTDTPLLASLCNLGDETFGGGALGNRGSCFPGGRGRVAFC